MLSSPGHLFIVFAHWLRAVEALGDCCKQRTDAQLQSASTAMAHVAATSDVLARCLRHQCAALPVTVTSLRGARPRQQSGTATATIITHARTASSVPEVPPSTSSAPRPTASVAALPPGTSPPDCTATVVDQRTVARALRAQVVDALRTALSVALSTGTLPPPQRDAATAVQPRTGRDDRATHTLQTAGAPPPSAPAATSWTTSAARSAFATTLHQALAACGRACCVPAADAHGTVQATVHVVRVHWRLPWSANRIFQLIAGNLPLGLVNLHQFVTTAISLVADGILAASHCDGEPRATISGAAGTHSIVTVGLTSGELSTKLSACHLGVDGEDPRRLDEPSRVDTRGVLSAMCALQDLHELARAHAGVFVSRLHLTCVCACD